MRIVLSQLDTTHLHNPPTIFGPFSSLASKSDAVDAAEVRVLRRLAFARLCTNAKVETLQIKLLEFYGFS